MKLEIGTAFELGCGGSVELLKLAKSGWHIGGIDYHKDAVELLKDYCQNSDYKQDFYSGDILSFNPNTVKKCSLLLSFGLLEHFKNPDSILSKWSEVLETNGLVVTSIPNLYSINAKLLANYDQELWHQHIPYSPSILDSFHQLAGLEVVKPASYLGDFDEYCLIPWNKIKQQKGIILFKFFKYLSSFVITPLFKIFSHISPATFSPYIIGVYRKP